MLAGQVRLWTARLMPGAAEVAIKANVTRALRLYRQDGRSEAAFAELLQIAGTRTLGRIQKPGAGGGQPHLVLFPGPGAPRDPPAVGDEPVDGAGVPASAMPPVPPTDAAPLVVADPLAPLPALEAEASPRPQSAPAVQNQRVDALLPSTALPDAPAPPDPPATDRPPAPDPRIWQAALVQARVALSLEDYNRVLRYALLLELDLPTGRALLGLPNDYLRDQVAGRLARPIASTLSQVCGQAIQVIAAVLPGAGPRSGPWPTLASTVG